MYYLQSRYFDPKICRFINADSYTSTGQGPLGYNMFAYCNNNPISRIDGEGSVSYDCMDDDPNNNNTPFDDVGGGGNSAQTQSPGRELSSLQTQNSPSNLQASSNSQSSTVTSSPTGSVTSVTIGTGHAPPSAAAGSVYTQVLPNNPNAIVSQTVYNEYGMPLIRVDYAGHGHGSISGPHIHTFYVYYGDGQVFINKGPIIPIII